VFSISLNYNPAGEEKSGSERAWRNLEDNLKYSAKISPPTNPDEKSAVKLTALFILSS
jgi:hypothetical protein